MRPSATIPAMAKARLTTLSRLPLRAKRCLLDAPPPVALLRLQLKVEVKGPPRPLRVLPNPLKRHRRLKLPRLHPPKVRLLRLKARLLLHLPGVARAIQRRVGRSLSAS